MTHRHATWFKDGWVFDTPLTFDVGSGVTTAIGGTATVYAISTSGAVVAGVATITSATNIRSVFAPSSLAVGVWTVQVRLAIPGQATQTFPDITVVVLPSAEP